MKFSASLYATYATYATLQHIGALQSETLTRLVRSESGIAPLNMMFLYKTAELVGNLAEQAHKVGNQMQVIVAR